MTVILQYTRLHCALPPLPSMNGQKETYVYRLNDTGLFLLMAVAYVGRCFGVTGSHRQNLLKNLRGASAGAAQCVGIPVQ